MADQENLTSHDSEFEGASQAGKGTQSVPDTPSGADNQSAPDIGTGADTQSAPDTETSGGEQHAEGGEEQPAEGGGKQPGKKVKKHLIKCTWLRRTLKTLMWIVIVILAIPVLLYIPPIQTLVKNIACDQLSQSTGMKVSVGKFRLGFPLDVKLQDVKILEASGDTMVLARELLADVKLLPLFRGDVDLNKVELTQGYYRMVSKDSSMVLTLEAGFLSLKGGSKVRLSDMNMDLRDPVLKDARINVAMDVWKSKPDTVSEPSTMIIRANRIRMENVEYSMQMLPYIYNLKAHFKQGNVENALVDLKNSKISIGNFEANGGDIAYTTETAEWVAAHPAPVDTVPSDTAPMTVELKKISLRGFSALYNTKGYKPLPGFDASYIQVNNLDLDIDNFYNCSSTVRVPITSLSGTERCGLSITSGKGTVAIDEEGIRLDGFDITTPFSALDFSALLTYDMLEFKPDGRLMAKGGGYVGFADIASYMPSLSTLLMTLPGTKRAGLDIDIEGTLGELSINNFGLDMPGLLFIKSQGAVANALDPANLRLHLNLDGGVRNSSPINRFLKGTGMKLPDFTLRGTVDAGGGNYSADLAMHSPKGRIALDGRVSMNAETYDATLKVNGLDVASIMPQLGVGLVTADVYAKGAGFNPTRPGAKALVSAEVTHAVYDGFDYGPLTFDGEVDKGVYDLALASKNPALDMDIRAKGQIDRNTYIVDAEADIYNLDLRKLNFITDTIEGKGWIAINGTANPTDMLFDLNMAVRDLDLTYGQEHVSLPEAADLRFLAQSDSTSVSLTGDRLLFDFQAPEGLESLTTRLSQASTDIFTQLAAKQMDFAQINQALPRFALTADIGAAGMLRQFIEPTGYNFDRLQLNLRNAETLDGAMSLTGLNTGTMLLDTITADLRQHSERMLYKLHLGNKAGNLPELARVDINGYVGGNRGSVALRQWNAQGENGYKIGMTAAINDSVLSLHCTPLNAVIGYKDWTINADNFIDLGPGKMIRSNLKAQGEGGSSIALNSGLTEKGHNYLDVALSDVHLQDFMMMFPDLPSIRGDLNSDLHLELRPRGVVGRGTVNLNDLYYENTRVGNLEADLRGGTNLSDGAGALLNLSLDKQHVLAFRGGVRRDSITGEEKTRVKMELDSFPLRMLNPFIGPDMMQLSGYLVGSLDVTGSLLQPMLNGSLRCDTVGVYLPIAASSLRFKNGQTVTVTDNLLDFNSFTVYGQSAQPLVLDGTVDATHFNDILLDLSLSGNNITLIDNDKRARSDVYGRLDVNVDALVKGSLSKLDVEGRLSVLPSTDVTYVLGSDVAAENPTTTDVVRFVQFNDTTQTEKADSLPPSLLLKINGTLNIVNGAQFTVNLNSSGTNRASLSPSGNLTYTQSYMGDTRVNGRININSGQVRYTPPLMSEKVFDFNPNSYVVWNGELMNPTLHLSATDRLKANVQQNGSNSRLIYFDVGLDVSGTLSAMKVNFDLATNEDITVQNELLSMTPEQRSTQAMNMLLYGTYTGPGVSASSNLSNPLYGFLASQLNNWAARTVRGVDLTFGIDQYKNTLEGETSTATSYSYQVSKSLFDNKFKIVVGGNYTTDAQGDQEFVENLISDVSFEYMLKQSNNLNMYLRLFRHTGWESILEGEITETGVGFVMKRKISNFKQLFRIPGRRRKKSASITAPAPADSTAAPADSVAPAASAK